MFAVIFKYFAFASAVTLLFANFIACGSQFYQVSVEDDIETNRTAGATPAGGSAASSNLGLHAPGGWEKLPIRFQIGESLKNDQINGLIAAMKVWEKAVGQKLFKFTGQHVGTTGDSFKDLYSSLADAINGHYLDFVWNKTEKDSRVLATTIWENSTFDPTQISTADIRFNSNHYEIGDSLVLRDTGAKTVVDMQSLATHEIGHLLGLDHVKSEDDPNSIMNTLLYIGEGLTTRRLSRGDILNIQEIYGCEGEACDVDQLAEFFETDPSLDGTYELAH